MEEAAGDKKKKRIILPCSSSCILENGNSGEDEDTKKPSAKKQKHHHASNKAADGEHDASVIPTLTCHSDRVNVDIVTILELKHDIFRDDIIRAFLDRESICNLMKVNTLCNHFELQEHFCVDHGTLLTLDVSNEKRKNFQQRKNSAKQDRFWFMTSNHPGCEDCVEGLDNRCRCVECDDFDEDFNSCDKCNRMACSNCFDIVETCDRCHPTVSFCEECFDGFTCGDCGNSYCNTCYIKAFCENEGCHQRGCSICMEIEYGILKCRDCNHEYCEECRNLLICKCDEKGKNKKCTVPDRPTIRSFSNWHRES